MDEQNSELNNEQNSEQASQPIIDPTPAAPEPQATDAAAQSATPDAVQEAAAQPPAPDATQAVTTQSPAPEATQAIPQQPPAPQATQAMPQQPPAPPQPPAPTMAGAAPMPGQPYPAYNAPVQEPPKPTGALVCGILSIVLAGVIGLILGIIAIVQANKYFKAGGTEGTAKGGKICGIIGIIVSAIAIVSIIVAIAFSVSLVHDYYDSYDLSTTTTESSSITDVTSEEEEAVLAVVNVDLDKIVNEDPEMIASIAQVVGTTFDDLLSTENLSLATLQVDPVELTKAMLAGSSYESGYVDIDGDEADATYYLNYKAPYSVMSSFYDDLQAMIEGELEELGSSQEAFAYIGQSLMGAVDSAEESEMSFSIELEMIDGEWVIDQDSWDEEIEYLFGF